MVTQIVLTPQALLLLKDFIKMDREIPEEIVLVQRSRI